MCAREGGGGYPFFPREDPRILVLGHGAVHEEETAVLRAALPHRVPAKPLAVPFAVPTSDADSLCFFGCVFGAQIHTQAPNDDISHEYRVL